MKKISELCPEAAHILKMDLEKLSRLVLRCVHSSKEPVKRNELAKTMADAYHPDHRHDVAHAFQEAIGFLEMQCLLGASPYDQDLIFVTRRGQAELEDGAHGEVPADVV